ncbi:MAG: hypothetical protein VKP62_03220 [Candidatus Sericytochromatia bacterium]|nr:hypothetical protein [Candidatus Sericytochromatia bacterium]
MVNINQTAGLPALAANGLAAAANLPTAPEGLPAEALNAITTPALPQDVSAIQTPEVAAGMPEVDLDEIAIPTTPGDETPAGSPSDAPENHLTTPAEPPAEMPPASDTPVSGVTPPPAPPSDGASPPSDSPGSGVTSPGAPTDCPPPPPPVCPPPPPVCDHPPAPVSPPSDSPSSPPSSGSPDHPVGGSGPASPAPSGDSGSPSSLPKDAIIIGNKKRPRTVRSFLKTMEKRGIKLPFNIKDLPKELLNTTLAKGQSLAIGTDGKPIGFLKTEDVMANQSLGVSDHLQRKVDTKGGLPRFETLGEGGGITIDGQSVNVVKTFLKSPVMLDLTGDGKLGTTGVSTAQNRIDNQVGKTVQFDVDGDGQLDQTEWMSGNGDGMLVDDRDGGATKASQGDGRIDGTRLFGDQGGKFANGYEKMAQLDADGDGKLAGKELEGLKTWVDDGDAKLEAGELKTLAELGVTEISTQMKLEKNARGEDLMRSTFTRNGEQQVSEDVWFNTKNS